MNPEPMQAIAVVSKPANAASRTRLEQNEASR